MITVVFTDGASLEFGRASMEHVPRTGETVSLVLSMAYRSTDALRSAKFKVESVMWEAHNSDRVEVWMYPYPDTMESKVILTVASLNDETSAYMERVREAARRLDEEEE